MIEILDRVLNILHDEVAMYYLSLYVKIAVVAILANIFTDFTKHLLPNSLLEKKLTVPSVCVILSVGLAYLATRSGVRDLDPMYVLAMLGISFFLHGSGIYNNLKNKLVKKSTPKEEI